MADETFDVIIIGGGNKGLVLAMYLAKYGGLDVAVFEKRHECGGGWGTDEGAAPGFLADYHATNVTRGYTWVLERDFPLWKELVSMTQPRVSAGTVFTDDDSCLAIYSRSEDKNQEKTAASLARFSQRDADTWLQRQAGFDKIALKFMKYCHTPPLPPGEPDALDWLVMEPGSGLDPSWLIKSPIEVLRDIFESDAVVASFLRTIQGMGIFPTLGNGIYTYFLTFGAPLLAGVVGGTHQWAHAACKIFLSEGGRIFNNKEVEKVVIENGKATGVRLTDSTEVAAKKFVVSTLDPYSLCFRLIGREHLHWRTLRRVENLERRFACVTWYTWALQEMPNYKAASFNPDINEASFLGVVTKDPEDAVKAYACQMMGKMPSNFLISLGFHSPADKTRAPEGNCAVRTGQNVLPANALSEREWIEFKKSHAEAMVRLWEKHTTNISWDKVIGYVPLTPYDHCRLANMAPTGNWAVIDSHLPSQFGRYRPIPELAGHRTPIKSLYATGTAWHPYGGATCFQGYNCYKVAAEDFGLRKPWEERGFSW